MILPVFLPHLGCGQRCIYCNQNIISDKHGHGIAAYVDSFLGNSRSPVEVALYGGNVLGLNSEQMEALFRPFRAHDDRITGFRLSAKPGPVGREQLNVLKRYRVKTIELGIPTFNDAILADLGRHHTTADLFNTYSLLQNEGFQTGLQVMVGLPGESSVDLRSTVSALIRLAPSFLRIYPLLVIEGTELAERYKKGDFLPETQQAAVAKTAFIYVSMLKHRIRTIKMGLTENEVLKKTILAGPYHPAFGYLVKSELFCLAILKTADAAGITGRVRILMNSKDIPHLIGHERSGLKKLEKNGITVERFESEIEGGSFILDAGEKKVKGQVEDALTMFPF
jgi:histone acetyltransferase (RNA polymerase elongator complex component)